MTVLSVVIHVDLDCFYAQVERERLGLPADTPLVVVQWNMALAVSYPARKFNIKRGSMLPEIRELGGDAVTIVRVETIGNAPEGGTVPLDAVPLDAVPLDAPAPIADADQQTQKVSLARYRNASAKVFRAMTECLSRCQTVFERASIDEAYIDVTAEVDRRLAASDAQAVEHQPDTVIVGDKLDLESETDRRLAVGAAVAAEVRAAVLKECRYTVSAGISVNKMLAKFASARNKPNKQTIVPLAAVESLMVDVPLRKLRGLGGKLGKEVESLGVSTAGEATKLSMWSLENKLGKRKLAEFVYNSVRGVDDSEVRERQKTKSLLAAKSFGSQLSLESVEKYWLPLLAEELAERIADDEDMNSRDAKTLVISFRVRLRGKDTTMHTASRSAHMPALGQNGRAPAIVVSATEVLRNVMLGETPFDFPINFVGLTATNFQDRVKMTESITRYFSKVEKPKDVTIEPNIVEPEAKMERRPVSLKRPRIVHSTRIDGFLKEDLKHGGERLLSDAEYDGATRHKKRLQESADREMALRLHREESLRGQPGTHKTASGAEPKPKASSLKGKLRSKGKEKANLGAGSMDRFVFKR